MNWVDRDYYSLWRWPFVVARRAYGEWLFWRRIERDLRCIR